MEVYNQKHGNLLWLRFLYFVAFITFGIVVLSLNGIFHNAVSRLFHTGEYFSAMFELTTIRIYLSLLLVSFPVFSVTFLALRRTISKSPHIKLLSERRQVYYGLLVLTFIVLFIRLIVFLYSLMSNELSLEYLSHFIIDVVMAGGIFGYTLVEVRTNANQE